MNTRASSRSLLAMLALALGAGCAHSEARPPDADAEAIREVHAEYRRAWLANDTEGVLRLFTSDAVLLPHHGLPAVVGAEAIRAFWFAPGPPTTITRLDLDLDEVSVRGSSAVVRGRSQVGWTVQQPSGLERWENAGTFLTLLRRDPDGRWRITHHMWDDPPNRRL
jgi:uncharacterized protein (TIGR02246 family)